MAHKLEDNGRGGTGRSSNEDETQSKALINRRDYVKLGAASVAATLGAGGLVGASEGDGGVQDTYITDFSEYSLDGEMV